MNEALSLAIEDLEPKDRYKLMSAVVIPRPIAFVSTHDSNGVLNAAPYSFFNVFSEAPVLVVLGIQNRPDGRPKDTAQNIRETGEFVVNLVDESLAEQMSLSSADLEPEDSEFTYAKMTPAPSVKVAPPRIAEAPIALECRRQVTMQFNADRDLIVGEVVHFHARAGIVNPENLRIDLEAYRPIGRLFGELYSFQHDVFAMKRGKPGAPRRVKREED